MHLSELLQDIKSQVLLALFLQNVLSTLVRRYVLGMAKSEVSFAEVLFVGEVLKGIFSAVYASREADPPSKPGYLLWLINPCNSWQMIALAGLYGVMNVLNFVAAARISASTFTVLVQLKILSTAGCAVLMLGRSYSGPQWRAVLLLLMSAVLVVQRNAPAQDCKHCSNSFEHLMGVLAVLGEVAGSGFASVYFEKVIKARNDGLTIWERNVQLAFWSMWIFVVMRAHEAFTKPQPIAHAWSFLVVALAFLGALGGVLVALTIKYADALMKTMAITGSLGLLTLIDYLFMGEVLSLCNLIGVACTMIGVLNYSLDPGVSNPRASIESHTRDVEQAEKQSLEKQSLMVETDDM